MCGCPCGKATTWQVSVWAKASLGQMSGVRAGLTWHSSVQVQWEQHWGCLTPSPVRAGQVNWKKTFCWYSCFSSWGLGLSCLGRALSLGLTVHPLRGLPTQPYWLHCGAIIPNPGLWVSGILLLLSMAACLWVLVMGASSMSSGMSAATFFHAL